MKVFHKAYGFLIRQAPNGNAEFPVFTAPDGSLHFPGGTVDDDEDLLTALCRELRELAVHHYYKPEVNKHIKRHDSLVQAAASLSDDFSFTVQSRAKDDGMLFEYRWIDIEHLLYQLDWEFRDYVTPEYIPECII